MIRLIRLLRCFPRRLLILSALTALFIPHAFADLLVGGGGEQIYRYDDRTGKFLGILIPRGSGGLNNVQGITVGPDRKLYMSSFGTREVLRFDGHTVQVFIPPGTGGMGAPNDVAFGPDGNLYVADGFFGTNSILRFNGESGAFIDVFASGGGLQQPNRMTFGPTGDLYVGNAWTSDVLRFHGDTGLPFPAPGQSGAIFVPGSFGPYNVELAVSSDSILAVTNGAVPGLRYYDAQTGALLRTPAPDLTNVSDMRFGPGGDLYLTIYASASVLRFEPTTGVFLGEFVPAASGGLNRAISLTFTCPEGRPADRARHCPPLKHTNGSGAAHPESDEGWGAGDKPMLRLPF